QEAEALACQLKDDRRRGSVCAFLTTTHALLGELDEGLVTCERALTIAGSLGDLNLRVLATTYREQLHYYCGNYDRLIEHAIDNLAVSPPVADSHFRLIHHRVWIILSLAQLGRFAEAAQYEADAIRLAEQMQFAFNIGLAHRAAGILHL